MNFMNRWALVAIAGLLVGLCQPSGALAVPAQPATDDSPLAIVPADAPIVVQINGFEKARGHLNTFLGNALPDLAPKLIKKVDDGLKELAEGRDLKVVAKDGRIFVLFTDLSTLAEEPKAVVLVPVESYAKFKDGLLKEAERKSAKKVGDGVESVNFQGKDEPMYLVERKGYVGITNDKDTAGNLAKGDAPSLGKTISKETAKAFLDQDVAVYVDLKAVNKQYGAQLRGLKTLVDFGLQGGMGINKKQIEMIKEVLNSLLGLFDDGVAAVLGLEFQPDGAKLHVSAQFGEGTDTNGFLKKLTPATLKALGALPTGQMLYSGSNFDPSQSKTLSLLVREGAADDEDEDAKKGIEAALKELSELRRVSEFTVSHSLTGALTVSEYSDGAQAVAATLKLFKSVSKTGSIGGMPLKERPEIKEAAEQIGDFKLHHVKLAFDFDKITEQLPGGVKEGVSALLTKLTGEKTNVWFGYSRNKVISVTAKDWATAKASIQEYLKSGNRLDADEGFQLTRKHLPAEATFVALGDTTRLIENIVELVKDAVAGLGAAIPDLKAPKGKPAYFGVAAVLKAEYATFDLFVPVAAVQQVRKMVAPLTDN
jgi:hypothetical protein